MSDSFDEEIEAFFKQGEREVDEFLERIGSEAEALNKANGNYKNHTYNLRRSNYHKVKDHVLEIGNTADYASDVSSRGYDVIDSGIQHIKKEIEPML